MNTEIWAKINKNQEFIQKETQMANKNVKCSSLYNEKCL